MMNKNVRKIKILDRQLNKDKMKSLAGEVHIKVVDKNGNIIDTKKQNTVVIAGRNAMMQRLTDVTYTIQDDAGNNITDARNYTLNFFAVGSGGAPSSDPFNPVSPNQSDYKLTNYVYISDPNEHVANDGIHKLVDSKTFKNPTTLLVAFTLDFSEANPKQAGNGDRVFINEAALFLTTTTDTSTVNSFIMLTRATFSTVEKTPDRKLEFEWFIYF